MTYETRQEVLRAAANWMDVCEAAGVETMCKLGNVVWRVWSLDFKSEPSDYEFPLALLEGKEVWVGSELYHNSGRKYTVQEIETFSDGRRAFITVRAPWVDGDYIENYSWNPPKPETVMVEMLVEDAKELETWMFQSPFQHRIKTACKKALENLK